MPGFARRAVRAAVRRSALDPPVARFYAGVAAAALFSASGAGAAEPAATTWAPFDTSGFYLGGHIGMASGGSAFTATQPGGAPGLTGTVDLFRPFDFFTGEGSNIGGFQFGYNAIYRSGLMLGLETDITFPGNMSGLGHLRDADDRHRDLRRQAPDVGLGARPHRLRIQPLALLRHGRLRLDRGQPHAHADQPQPVRDARRHDRDQIPGAERVDGRRRRRDAPGSPLDRACRISLFRLRHIERDVSVRRPALRFRISTTQQWRVGLNYQLGETAAKAGNGGIAPLEGDNWVIHGQTTFVNQYAPPFHAPYHGQNSLDSNSGRETWDATLYVGVSPWQGAEIWVNPEIDQGFGLSNTLGLAGFPSAEAYKLGENDPYLRVPRYFIRQTIDFGAATEKVDADINQFAGKQSPDRLVLTVGKFSASDIFDTVKYAHDPRNDFLNWTLVDAGTWDYSADAWGYTYGATAEWYHGPWAVRGGLFDLSIVPNSIELDRFHEFQINYEVERRHEIAGQPGSIMFDGFVTRGRMGEIRRRDRVRAAVRRHGGHRERPPLSEPHRLQL